jgi:hypothetical protein
MPGDGLPLAPGRERRPAASDQSRLGDLADDRGRTDGDRPPQRFVASGGAVGVEALRVDGADAGDQPQRSIGDSGLRHGVADRRFVAWPLTVDAPLHGVCGRRREHLPARR